MRISWLVRLGCLCTSLSCAAYLPAQDTSQNAPLLNAIGRFWGFGYSQGYHACNDGRAGWGLARDFHHSPSPDPSLTAIYSMHYQPMQVGRQFHQTTWPMGSSSNGTYAPGVSSVAVEPIISGSKSPASDGKAPVAAKSPGKSTAPDSQKSPSDRPTVPARPSTPPPEWLKRYLPQPEVGGAVLLNDVEAVEKPSANQPQTKTPARSATEEDDLLVPQDASDDLLLPQTQSQSVKPAPIHLAPPQARTSPRTAGSPNSGGLAPKSITQPPQRR